MTLTVGPGRLEAPKAPDRSVESLPARLWPPLPAPRWLGWLGALVVTAVAAVIRFVDLGRPHAVMFDETYYAKEGLSLIRFGYERLTVEGANDIMLDSNGDWRALDIFKEAPAFVVHPPLGKWAIGAGEFLFGATPFGWRFTVALLGTLSVLMLTRIVRRMTRSDLIGVLAGLFLALDGVHITLSRIALLDMVLSFFALLAFCCLVLDRDMARKRLARLVERTPADVLSRGWGPRIGPRPWRWAAGISLGLACGVKWSGVWFIVVFGLLTVLWDIGMRRAIGVRRPIVAALVRSAPPAFVSIVGLALLAYLATWTGWFLSDNAWGRNWAASQPNSIIPGALRSLWHYHVEAYDFSVNLTADHSYESNPLSWMLQTRPVAFFYESYAAGVNGCTVSACASEVLAVGNIVVWWGGTLALIHQIWRWFAYRDWRSGAFIAGIIAGWCSWFLFLDRTIFSFYAVAFVPFVAAILAMSVGSILGPLAAASRRRLWGAIGAGAIVLLAVVAAWWWYPIWTAEVTPTPLLILRVWMPTWV